MPDKKKYKMKGVNFNLDNPAEKRLWDYACSISSFSGFVKHLLTDHLASGWDAPTPAAKWEKKEETKVVSNKKDRQSAVTGATYDF